MNFLLFLSIFYIQLNLFFSANPFSKNNLLKKYNREAPIISNYNKKINLCINCKHFRPDYILLIPNNEFAKCSVHNRLEENDNYLVTGEMYKKEIKYTYCSIARNNENMCGKEGKDFVSKH